MEDLLVQKKSLRVLFLQLIKFGVVGVINTGIDFAILNLLMFLTNVHRGGLIIALNAISFSIATINSYFFNKFWTFSEKKLGTKHVTIQFSQFLSVSIGGIIINTGIVYLLTTFSSPMFGLGPTLWANLAKVLATGISLIWNFIGYKLFVFKK